MLREPLACRFALVLALFVSSAKAQTPPPKIPINDLGTGLYLNQFQGGLYPNGSNVVPATHAAAGASRAAAIQPRNTAGVPDANGKYGLISIGYSNSTQEFCSQNGAAPCNPWTFMGQAAANSDVNHSTLAIVNGAMGGQDIPNWDQPTDPNYDRIIGQWLTPNGLSEKQIQAAWVDAAIARPTVSLPDPQADAYQIVRGLGDVVRSLKTRYPNLQQVFLSSRTYGGYATTAQNPEPYAYETGFAVKWLIEAQINQMNGGGIDPLAGDLNYNSGVVPWLAWGPYSWADGLNPRSDGLTWERGDFVNDGTHPSQSGETKVGNMLMDFFLNSEFTQPWFVSLPGDYNKNGSVDAADYVVWRDDPNRTQAQYDVWRANFGRTVGTVSGSELADPWQSNVPEPATLWLLSFTALMLSERKAVRGLPNSAARLVGREILLPQAQVRP